MVLERMSGRNKQVLCNSDQTRDQVSEYFGYTGSTTWYPIDTALFRPLDKLEARRALGLTDSEHIGLFVGNTQPTKNFGLVRQLIDKLGNVKWMLALRGQVPKIWQETIGFVSFETQIQRNCLGFIVRQISPSARRFTRLLGMSWRKRFVAERR